MRDWSGARVLKMSMVFIEGSLEGLPPIWSPKLLLMFCWRRYCCNVCLILQLQIQMQHSNLVSRKWDLSETHQIARSNQHPLLPSLGLQWNEPCLKLTHDVQTKTSLLWLAYSGKSVQGESSSPWSLHMMIGEWVGVMGMCSGPNHNNWGSSASLLMHDNVQDHLWIS